METNLQQPCLVETPQGFSISYKNKFLYSKYNPKKNILQTIENLQLLPGTIILCCSPVLSYGLKELSQKLPENCIMLGCELEDSLLDFINSNIENYKALPNFTFLTKDEIYNLPPLLTNNSSKLKSGFILPKTSNFRRILKIDFSSGVQFHQQTYDELYNATVNALMTFWSNRITLTKFGRLYSKNFFKNLKLLKYTTPIENYFSKIEKSIIVCGAGESLDFGVQDFINNREKYFILCVDTALQPLLKHKIIPDGVFIEEAQNIILKAFIGTKKYNFQIFAGLSSQNALFHNFDKKNISFFTTEYAPANFISELKQKKILPFINKPFGSVGLTAVFYALKFRKSENIPIYFYGLDFSYTAGRTHAKGTLAEDSRLISKNKINSSNIFNSCWNENAEKIIINDEKILYTTKILKNYANMFKGIFFNEKNLYNSSDFGLNLTLKNKKPQNDLNSDFKIKKNDFSNSYIKKIDDFLENEYSELKKLKSLLIGEINSENLEKNIISLIKNKEYLYLHFPDGTDFQYNQSFLNRIRTEIDCFLKILSQKGLF